MRVINRSHVSAAAAAAVLTLIIGVVAFSGSGEAAPRHTKARIDATTLNGYRANQLVKAANVVNPNSIDGFDTCTYTTTQTLAVRAPRNGFLMVWASVGAARDTDFTGDAELVARLALGAQRSADHATQLTTDGSFDGNVEVQTLFSVKKGLRTVQLQLKECSSSAAFVTDQTISSLFVPFGSTKVVAKIAQQPLRN